MPASRWHWWRWRWWSRWSRWERWNCARWFRARRAAICRCHGEADKGSLVWSETEAEKAARRPKIDARLNIPDVICCGCCVGEGPVKKLIKRNSRVHCSIRAIQDQHGNIAVCELASPLLAATFSGDVRDPERRDAPRVLVRHTTARIKSSVTAAACVPTRPKK